MPTIDPHPAPAVHFLLRAVGAAITVGDYWVSPLARALGVGSRTLREWLDGEAIPPPGIYTAIADLCEQRAADLAAVAATARHIAANPPAQRKPGRKPAA